MRKVSESGFETGLGPAMRGQTGLETAPDNRTVTRFTYAPEQKVRVLSQTLVKNYGQDHFIVRLRNFDPRPVEQGRMIPGRVKEKSACLGVRE